MSKKYTQIYIALGANLSNPKINFRRALEQLGEEGATIDSVSSLWESPAWPAGSDQPNYLNACAKLSYQGEAADLLALLHAIEASFGRERKGVPNAARSLDLDLLDFNGQIHTSPDLQIPHPRMLERGFVLFPLHEIAPNWRDPQSHKHIDQFIARLPLADVAPMYWRGAL